MKKVGIIGGSGYTGGELIRLLMMHPEVEIVGITSKKFKDRPVHAVHSFLRGFSNLKFSDHAMEAVGDADLVFTAVPHGTAMDYVPQLLDMGLKVIDLSADYRLSVEEFERIYGLKHKAPRQAVYGLTELHPEVKDAKLVANPGCFPTGAVLAVAPLFLAGVVERVVFDSKTGISGAGAEATQRTHYPNVAENVVPYNITTHRHIAEIKQELLRFASAKISFTPHVVPAIRGILTTAHLFVNTVLEAEEIQKIYENCYRNKPFIRMNTPRLSAVRGSNFCDIDFEVDKGTDRIVVISAIDNLVKGAAGQAIQNMNLMLGFKETTGLWMPATAP